MKLTDDQRLDLESAMREAAKDFDAGAITEILDTDDDDVIKAALEAIADASVDIYLGGAR